MKTADLDSSDLSYLNTWSPLLQPIDPPIGLQPFALPRTSSSAEWLPTHSHTNENSTSSDPQVDGAIGKAISDPDWLFSYWPLLCKSFYANFSSAHPFLMPLKQLEKHLQDHSLLHLQAAICFAGSFYVPTVPRESIREMACSLLVPKVPSCNPYTVQALLLLALCLNACNDIDTATQALSMAIDLALELQMNTAKFAMAYSPSSPIEQESWRRTWWELYCVNGFLAAMRRGKDFYLFNVPTDVGLPCEERHYQANACLLDSHLVTPLLTPKQVVPEPRSIDAYDNRAFSGDEVFSSYAYRIDAIRILGSILILGNVAEQIDMELLNAADRQVTNWVLHLPACKSKTAGDDAVPDEMLFQAHMIINAYISSHLVGHRGS